MVKLRLVASEMLANPRDADALFDWLTTTTSPAMERAAVDQAQRLGTDPVSLLEACEAIVHAGMLDDGALGLAAITQLHGEAS